VDDLEHQLPRLFESAAAQLEPPIEDIVTVSTRLGRKRRARRTAGMTAAAVGVVGITAGVVFGVQRFGFGSVPSGPVAADRPSTGQSTSESAAPRTSMPASPRTRMLASPHPGSPVGTTTADASGSTAVAPLASELVHSTPTPTLTTTPDSGPQVAVSLLTHLVSAYGLHAVRQTSTTFGVADVVYDDGHGQSELIASVREYSADLKNSNAYTCTGFSAIDEAQRPSGAPAPSCTATTTADGHVEYLVVTGDDGAGFYDFRVDLFTADNMVVSLVAGNGVPQGATVDVTRAVPPLTLAEMQAIVADPAWLGYTDPPL
jgi:hypothetical protein